MDLRDQLQTTLGTTYTLERELGGGGMSRVFVADETRLGRKVVVKVLSPELAAGINSERFEREIRLAASLQHANIVPVLSAGDTDGMPYYTMPFVSGESLRARLRDGGRLPIGEAVSVLRDVARALAYAHEHGIVHRDIKPDNVLLSGGAAVVTDFGIAKAISQSRTHADDGALTQLGTALGTPAYMAPEQAAGDPAADHRADIYSFGCMAYELLAGQAPFANRSVQRIVAAHMTETPRSVRESRPDTPAPLAAMVMRCLEKDAAARPQSAGELLAALDAASSDATREAAPPARTRADTRRRPIGFYAVALGIVMLAGGFFLLRTLGIGPSRSLLAAGKLPTRAPVLITDFTATNTDSALGAVVSDAVRAGLAQSPVISLVSPAAVAAQLRLMNRPPASRLDLEVAREVAQRQGVKAIADGNVTGVPGGYILSVRLITADSGVELASFRESGDGPRGLIDAADKLARELRGKIGESLESVQASPPLERVTTASLDALRKFSAANRANAGGAYREAVSLAEQAVSFDTSFASAWRLLAVAMSNADMSQAGIDSSIERAYRHADRLPEPERSQTVASYLHGGPHRDRTKALALYATMMQRGDSGAPAINAGELLRSRRQYAPAESLDLAAIRARPSESLAYLNVIELALDRGHIAEAAAVLDTVRRRMPETQDLPRHALMVDYARGDLRRVQLAVDSLTASRDAERHGLGLQAGAELGALQGQLAKAGRLYLQARGGAPHNALESLLDSVTIASAEAWFRGMKDEAAARIDHALELYPFRETPLADRPYFVVATAYARAGRPGKAGAIIAAYRRDVTDTALVRLGMADLHNALGEIALAEGKPREALAEFRRGDVDYDGQPARECAPCLEFNLARAFDAANMADSAIAAWERFLTTPYYNRLDDTDPLGLAGAHKRLGELYEANGNREKAIAHYQRFVELWRNADPALQTGVADVKRRIDRLSDVERP